MSTKQKATTAHGEMEYETVDCAHCESATMVENAIAIYIDPKEMPCGGAMVCKSTYPSATKESALCPYCAESIFGYERTGSRHADYVRATVSPPVGFFASLVVGLLVGLAIGIVAPSIGAVSGMMGAFMALLGFLMVGI